MLACRETARLITASRERRLTLKERIQLYFHLRACALCRRFKKQMDLLEASLKKVVGSDASSGLPPQARERILKKIEEFRE